jgi:hypothetical protein
MSEHHNESVFIPLIPGRKKILTEMAFTMSSGLILFAASVWMYLVKRELVVLQALAIPFSIYVVWYSWVAYRNPQKTRWPQLDTLRNLTGFMIIALTAGAFVPSPGLGISHVFLLLGTGIIFKGVMFSSEKNKAGFWLTGNILSVKVHTFRRQTDLGIDAIKEISFKNDMLTIHQLNGTILNWNLTGFDRSDEAIRDLKTLIDQQQHQIA